MNWSYLFLSFEGRINRKPYWIATIILLVAEIVCLVATEYFELQRLSGIIGLALLYPSFAVMIKRAHDRETPLWILILFVILDFLQNGIVTLGLDGSSDEPTTLYWAVALPAIAVALYLLITLGFYRGVAGPNRYGPNPLERQPA